MRWKRFNELDREPEEGVVVQVHLYNLTSYWEVVGGIECILNVKGKFYNYLIKPGDVKLYPIDFKEKEPGPTYFELDKVFDPHPHNLLWPRRWPPPPLNRKKP